MKRRVKTENMKLESYDEIFGNKTVDPDIQMLPIDYIIPFHDHPFHLYDGDRLNDMVQSIKAYGILNPVIVRKLNDNQYETLSGHNRINAAKLAGLSTIPAIVKENLPDEEAYVYVIETNLIQRSFSDLLPTEKAVVLAERYEKVLYARKRDEILKELQMIEIDTGKGGHDVHVSKNRDSIGNDYCLSGRNVARYLRVNQLIDEFKQMLDQGKLALVAGVDLSYLDEDIQKKVFDTAKKHEIKLVPKIAKKIRKEIQDVSKEEIGELLLAIARKNDNLAKSYTYKLSASIYNRFFKDMEKDDIEDTIEVALEIYFQDIKKLPQ